MGTKGPLPRAGGGVGARVAAGRGALVVGGSGEPSRRGTAPALASEAALVPLIMR